MFSDTEIERYDRHLKLKEVGLSGQEKLKQAKVLVVGAGGLGCPVLQYLTATGVGKIGVIDDDVVSLSNLQRQILYGTNDIGKPKVQIAKKKLSQQNPFVEIEAIQERLTTENSLALFNQYDIIVDATDNFSTRYLVNDSCVLLGKPLVYGSISKFEGQVSVFNYQGSATYRCLFPEPPKPDSIPNCSEAGVLGVLPGIIGLKQANEVLKIILQIGEVLADKLLLYNALNESSVIIQVKRNEAEVKKVLTYGLDENYDLVCGVLESIPTEEITTIEAKKLVKEKDVIFLDVRDHWEQPKLSEVSLLEIPLEELEDEYHQIPKDKKVIVFCQSGGRSRQAIDYLKSNYNYTNLINLKGGVLEW